MCHHPRTAPTRACALMRIWVPPTRSTSGGAEACPGGGSFQSSSDGTPVMQVRCRSDRTSGRSWTRHIRRTPPRAGTSARPQSRARRPAVEPADCRAASERRSDGLTAWARQAELVVAKQLKYGAVQPMPEHSDAASAVLVARRGTDRKRLGRPVVSAAITTES